MRLPSEVIRMSTPDPDDVQPGVDRLPQGDEPGAGSVAGPADGSASADGPAGGPGSADRPSPGEGGAGMAPGRVGGDAPASNQRKVEPVPAGEAASRSGPDELPDQQTGTATTASATGHAVPASVRAAASRAWAGETGAGASAAGASEAGGTAVGRGKPGGAALTPGDLHGVSVAGVQAESGTSEESRGVEGVATPPVAPRSAPDGEVDAPGLSG